MKSLVLLLLSTLSCLGQLNINNPFYVASIIRPVSSGGGSISDNFNGRNEHPIASGWTQIKDFWATNDIAFSPQDFTNDPRGAAYEAVSCGSIKQYVKFTILSANTAIIGGCLVRWTDSSSGFYGVYFRNDADTCLWYYYSSAADTAGTLIDSQALVFTLPATFGVTVQGTGNGTIINCWLNPTAAAPTTVDLWDGAGPTQTMTADPGTAKDTGNYIGLLGLGSGGDVAEDTFSGGGLP